MSGKLGDILIQQGVIDEEKLIAALSDQRAFGGKLVRTLVDLGYVSEEQLVHALAAQLGLDTGDLAQAEIAPEALSTLPVDPWTFAGQRRRRAGGRRGRAFRRARRRDRRAANAPPPPGEAAQRAGARLPRVGGDPPGQGDRPARRAGHAGHQERLSVPVAAA